MKKKLWKRIVALLLVCLLSIVNVQMIFADNTETTTGFMRGNYQLPAGGSRAVYATADLTVADTMTITLYIPDSVSNVRYQGVQVQPQAAVVLEEKTYYPYLFTVTEKTESLELTEYIAAMNRDTNATITLDWSGVPTCSYVPVSALKADSDEVSRLACYEKAEVIAEGDVYKVTVYFPSSVGSLTYNGQTITQDAAKDAITQGETTYNPYTFTLTDKAPYQAISAFITRMGSTQDIRLYFQNEALFPKTAQKQEQNGDETDTDTTKAGKYKMNVANASTSSYSSGVVYPQAELELTEAGEWTITVLLKDSITNIRTESGESVAAGEAQTLTVDDKEGTYYPYTFSIEKRQAVLKVLDDVPAMSHVAAMNYGKDMTTTINLDWDSVEGLEKEVLANDFYELPVALSTPSTMITLADKAHVLVKDGIYEMRLYFPAGTVTALTYGETQAELVKGSEYDTFVFTLTGEEGIIPVRISVAKMAGTAMETQSFSIIPDWTGATAVAYQELNRQEKETAQKETQTENDTDKQTQNDATAESSVQANVNTVTAAPTEDTAATAVPIAMMAVAVLMLSFVYRKKQVLD